MKTRKIISTIISFALCALVLLGSVTTAYGNTDADRYSDENYTEGTKFGDLLTDFISSVFLNEKTLIQSKGSTLEVRPPFIIAPLHSEANIFSSIVSWVFVYTNVTVEGYDGNYIKVKVNKTDERGYIHKILLTTDKSYLVQQYSNVYVGKSKKILKDYNNPEDFSWFVSQEGVIHLNKQTGEIKGLKPGTVTVTAEYNGKTNKCVVSSINQWKKTETSVATKDITVKSNPDNSSYKNFDKGTITEGTTIIARGDLSDGSGWIYVSDKAEKVWGFIKLSDFPGIDYLFTEYHYYDQGYNIRFGSAENKIYTYASVMNDIMIDLFNLKINPYVYSYTSPADQCKILRYGSVKSNNLASSCPKNGSHDKESCLTTDTLREVMYSQGNNAGNDYAAKTVWTGHIMDGHKRSNSQRNPTFIIIFTTGNTVNKQTYTNKSDSNIRKYSIYELIHETSHQLGTRDHYCYGKDPATNVCKNPYCDECVDNKTAPFCIMNLPFNVESYDVDKLFCDECKQTIKAHLAEHH